MAPCSGLSIDRDGGGVTLDDCELASNTASAVLDASDPIDHPYRLEVSSPGAERPIRRAEEWTAAVGRRVNVRLRDGDAELVLEGKLVAVTGSDAEIEVRDRRTHAGGRLLARRRARGADRRRHLMAAPAVTLTALRDLAAATPLSEAEITSAVEQGVATAYRRLVEDDRSGPGSREPRVRHLRRLSPRRGRRASSPSTVDVPDFPRQAAAAARTAVAERLASVEQRRILGEGASQRGVLRDAIVERRLGSIWYVDAGGVPGMLPPEEQIPGERLTIRDHIKVVIVEGRRKGPDALVVVSRSHPQLVQRLMEQEVPELQSGQVVVRAIARDPGRRTKVAVDAPDGDVDPQGACIGRNGVRQRAVTSELGEEQVQIVAWSADPSTFVMNSLIPATARGVELDTESRTAHISVAADQLSLAIGRGGRERPPGGPPHRLADRHQRG